MLFSNIMIHSNIITQHLDILAECSAINDGQLYILRGHKLYFRKKTHSFTDDRFCLNKQCRL